MTSSVLNVWSWRRSNIWEETNVLFFFFFLSEKSDIVCAHHALKAGVRLPRKVLLLCLLMPRRHAVEVFDEGIVHGKVWDGCGGSKWHKSVWMAFPPLYCVHFHVSESYWTEERNTRVSFSKMKPKTRNAYMISNINLIKCCCLIFSFKASCSV